MPADRIGLFGGTFDPVHLAHLQMAESAQREFGLGRVFFIPCSQSPWKDAGADAGPEHRVAMLELALENLPWAEISRIEVDRPPPSYSWQTAEAFAARFPPPSHELCWILGADQWEGIRRWARPDRLAALLTFLVFPRPGHPFAPQKGFRAASLPFDCDLSSTQIREALRRGDPTPELLPPGVSAYIESHGLYQTRNARNARNL